MKPLRTSGCVIGALLCFLACSSDDTPASGGLALTIATDGSVAPDRINVKVSSDTSVFFESELASTTATLPRTVNVKASGSAKIVVQAWSGSTPLDRRDVTVTALPTDHFAPYQVLLSARCTPLVRAAGDGTITSVCAADTTCDPTNGACGGATVNAGSPDSGAGSAPDDGGSTTGPCAQGATRCTGRNLEICTSDAQWQVLQMCPAVCKDSACTGECVPGDVICCETVVTNGQPGRNCVGDLSSKCIEGTGRCMPGEGNPTQVFLAKCDDEGHYQVGLDCMGVAGTQDDGTVIEGCAACPNPGALEGKPSCLKKDGTNSCSAAN